MISKKIIKKAQKGDKSAFTALINSINQDLYKLAKTKLTQECDIYDAIQETIIASYQSLYKLSNYSKFKPWIYKILLNKCNDIYREKYKFNTISYDSNECEKYISTNLEFESNIEFDNLLSSLEDEEKTIIVLYYLEDFKSKEIANILKINENTVRSKILRAKRKIQKKFKEVL